MNFSGPIGRGGEPGDRNRRGVCRDQRPGAQFRRQLFKDRALDVFLFGRGLNHHVAIAEQAIIEPGGDAGHRRVFFLLADPAARDLTRQVALDGVAPAPRRLFADVGHHDIEPGQRADMGDAATHLAGADHADAVQTFDPRCCRRSIS